MNTLTALVLTGFLGMNLSTEPAVAESVETISESTPSQSQQIWGCSARNATRSYVVDQLNPNSNRFDMAIYAANRDDYSGYIGTVEITLSETEAAVVGIGETFNSTLKVNALGPTVAFGVNDSVTGQATGRCYVQWQMADDDTRHLVRQCFALYTRRYGSLPEVSRFGCTVDPASSIEDLTEEE